MIQHVSLSVKDYPKSEIFYSKVLATLGMREVLGEKGVWSGYGENDESGLCFEIGVSDEKHPASQGVHVAFVASSKKAVEGFYATALANGATNNGAPGYRKQYTPGYYAAFVIDLDGHNIEAVFEDPNPTE